MMISPLSRLNVLGRRGGSAGPSYVSNSGNDVTGNGLLLTPYATLAKASTELKNGQTLYLAKGSTFINDKLDLSGKSNITIDSYGSGAAPILTGLKSVSGFTNEAGNIWSKQDNNFPAEITNAFTGATKLTLARSAEKTATGGNTTTLVDSALTEADNYWLDAEMYWSYGPHLKSIVRVTAYASKSFTIPETDVSIPGAPVSCPPFPVSSGVKYYIQNHRGVLTTQNQYAYKQSTKTLYIYSTTEPVNITVAYGTDCIYGDGVNNCTIQNIAINSSSRFAVYFTNSTALNLNNISTLYSGYSSIALQYCSDIYIDGCTLSDQNSNGIVAIWCTDLSIGTLQQNVISKCGYLAGCERYIPNLSVAQSSYGIRTSCCVNDLILYNDIYDIGNMGICLVLPTDALVQYNYVHNVFIHWGDGSAIYASYAINTKFLNNIAITAAVYGILNSGYHLDIDCVGCEIAYNFAKGFWSSLVIERNNDNYVHDNMCISTTSLEGFSYYVLYPEDINNVISDNIYVNEKPDTICVNVRDGGTPVNTVTGNKYYYPFGKAGTGSNNSMFMINGVWKTLIEWIADESRVTWGRTALNELEISPALHTLPNTDKIIYLTNPSKVNRTVQSAELTYSDYVNLDSSVQTYPFTIAPYGSKVLVRPDPTASALIARMTVAGETPTVARQALINSTIGLARQKPFWAKLDALWVTASHGSGADGKSAKMNWIADAYNLIDVVAPTFTEDRGYKGNASTMALNTQLVLTTAGLKYSLNSATVLAYSRTDQQLACALMGAYGANTSDVSLQARSATDTIGPRVNTGTSPTTQTLTNSSGLLVQTRTSSSNVNYYRPGTKLTFSSNSVVLPNTYPLNVFRRSGASPVAYSSHEISILGVGSSFTDQDVADFNTVFVDGYLASIGAKI